MVASWPFAGEAVTVSGTSFGTQWSTACSVFLKGITSYPIVEKTFFNEARVPGSRTLMARITGRSSSVRRVPRRHTHRDRRHVRAGTAMWRYLSRRDRPPCVRRLTQVRVRDEPAGTVPAIPGEGRGRRGPRCTVG